MNTAAAPPPSRRARAAAATALALILVGAAAMIAFPSGVAMREDLPSSCPFKLLTGYRCPLCGMTRATFRMARGDLTGALHLHPLAPIVLALVAGGALLWLACVATGRPMPRWARPRWFVVVPVAVAVWIVNLRWGTG